MYTHHYITSTSSGVQMGPDFVQNMKSNLEGENDSLHWHTRLNVICMKKEGDEIGAVFGGVLETVTIHNRSGILEYLKS